MESAKENGTKPETQLAKRAPESQNIANSKTGDQIRVTTPLMNEQKAKMTKMSTDCPFLSTIKRHMLDFDHEKSCSITASSVNIYCCLVCGVFYQGRGRDTHAYKHSLEQGHYLFINLNDLRVYCLPENYEVIDKSLDDIRVVVVLTQFNLRPSFTFEEVKKIDSQLAFCKSLEGRKFIQGIF